MVNHAIMEHHSQVREEALLKIIDAEVIIGNEGFT